MKIQPITPINYTNSSSVNRTNYKKPISLNTYSDSVSFTACNFQRSLKDIATAHMERESTVESYFKILMNSLSDNKNFVPSSEFRLVQKTYKEKGLRGMLLELCRPYPAENLKGLVERLDNDSSLTIGSFRTEGILEYMGEYFKFRTEEPVVKLVSFGRQGFWNSLIDNKNSARDIRLMFSKQKSIQEYHELSKTELDRYVVPIDYSVELGLDKKTNLTIDQQHGDRNIFTVLDLLTGHKRVVVTSYKNCRPEYEYFKKDGTKAYLKNFFFGGMHIEPIY